MSKKRIREIEKAADQSIQIALQHAEELHNGGVTDVERYKFMNGSLGMQLNDMCTLKREITMISQQATYKLPFAVLIGFLIGFSIG